jgi:hypothetical protein
MRRIGPLSKTLPLLALTIGALVVTTAAQAQTAEQLKAIAKDSDSGAIEATVGEVYTGPGVIAVGWVGAKKQVVVPNGPWVVLGAKDYYSAHSTRIPMTRIALGQFEGNTLRSLLYATFNSRPGPSTATWTDAAACEAEASASNSNDSTPQGFAWVTPPEGGAFSRYRLKQCVRARAIRHTPTPEFWRGELADTVFTHLQQMNAVPSNTTALRSDLYVTDGLSANIMIMTRLDFGAPAASSTTPAAHALDMRMDARQAWMKAYAPLATQGLTWSLELPVLTGQALVTGKAAALPN